MTPAPTVAPTAKAKDSAPSLMEKRMKGLENVNKALFAQIESLKDLIAQIPA